jgi:hypothetical protein
MAEPPTSGGVYDRRPWVLFVASVPPYLVMMSGTEGRALPNTPAADDIDAKAFTAFDPPALAVVGLAQQNLAGRGDKTHVRSHGINYRMLLMLCVRFQWNRTCSRGAHPRPEPSSGANAIIAHLVCA